MATFRVRPSKPVAVFSAVIGVVVMVFLIIQFSSQDDTPTGVWFFLLIPVLAIGFNLWAAFAKNGSINTIESDDGPPVRMGQTTERVER